MSARACAWPCATLAGRGGASAHASTGAVHIVRCTWQGKSVCGHHKWCASHHACMCSASMFAHRACVACWRLAGVRSATCLHCTHHSWRQHQAALLVCRAGRSTAIRDLCTACTPRPVHTLCQLTPDLVPALPVTGKSPEQRARPAGCSRRAEGCPVRQPVEGM